MPAVSRNTSQLWRGPYPRGEFETPDVRPAGRNCQCHSKAQPAGNAGQCRSLAVDSVALLASHKGKGGPDLVIQWNNLGSRPEAVDIVVHLHGHAKCRHLQDPQRLDLCRDIMPVSGLDFRDPDGKDLRNDRQRPTIALLPRGNYTGTDAGTGYNFPALRAPGGLQKLIDFALSGLQQQLGTPALRPQRLVLTVHSGGGSDLQEILRQVNPHEVHVMDALYGLRASKTGYVLEEWAAKRIARDLDALKSGQAPARYMAEQGGALRVISLTTGTHSSIIGQALGKIIPAGSPLAKWYRVEYTCEEHCLILGGSAGNCWQTPPRT